MMVAMIMLLAAMVPCAELGDPWRYGVRRCVSVVEILPPECQGGHPGLTFEQTAEVLVVLKAAFERNFPHGLGSV